MIEHHTTNEHHDHPAAIAGKPAETKEAVLTVRVVLDFTYARKQLAHFAAEPHCQELHIPVCGDDSPHRQAELLKSIFHHLHSIERSLTGASHHQGISMTPETQALIDQAHASADVNASALVVINGIVARIDTAVAAAVAAGTLSPADAATLTQETADLKASSDALASAVATDAAGNPTPPAVV